MYMYVPLYMLYVFESRKSKNRSGDIPSTIPEIQKVAVPEISDFLFKPYCKNTISRTSLRRSPAGMKIIIVTPNWGSTILYPQDLVHNKSYKFTGPLALGVVRSQYSSC